jgi:hypothetical protein
MFNAGGFARPSVEDRPLRLPENRFHVALICPVLLGVPR